jgi:hypothetical protein
MQLIAPHFREDYRPMVFGLLPFRLRLARLPPMLFRLANIEIGLLEEISRIGWAVLDCNITLRINSGTGMFIMARLIQRRLKIIKR